MKTTTSIILLTGVLVLSLGGLAIFTRGGADMLHADENQQPRVLPVSVIPVQINDAYQTERRYLGSVEATRRSQIGFELGGKIETLLVDEGDPVQAGQALAVLDTELLDARLAELNAVIAEAETGLRLAETTLQRSQRAVQREALSRQALDEAEQQRDAAQATLNRARAQLRSVELQIEKSTLRAPYDAVIAARLLDEGVVANAGQTIFSLLERDRYELHVGMPERWADRLVIGQSYPVRASGGSTVEGTLKRIIPQKELRTRTLTAIFDLNNDAEKIYDGALLEVVLSESVPQKGFWIPQSALTEKGRGLWSAFVLKEDPEALGGATHTVELLTLELVYLNNDEAYVEGIARNDQLLVAEGTHRLTPGQHVRLSDTAGSVAVITE